MRTFKRRDKLPSVFCAFPWVRQGRGAFADAATQEDQELVKLYQDILLRRRDVSALDDEYSLKLAVEIPESILKATGTSNAGFSPTLYYWKLYDVNYLLNDTQPAEALPISVVGFTDDELIALGKSDRYLAYVRSLEEYVGKPRGHYFPKDLEEQIEDFERRNFGKIKLRQRLLGLRQPSSSGYVRYTSINVPEGLRNEVLKFHNYSCLFDGRTRPGFQMHVHHVIPQKLIERLSLPERLFLARENLVTACAGCNIVKSDDLSKVDVRFYLDQFSKPHHPNKPLLPFLERICALQDYDSL